MGTTLPSVHPYPHDDFGVDSIPSQHESGLNARALGALIDLGMSDRQIADYLRTPEERIVSLRLYYGLK